jgi:hypothetical protein
MMKRNTLVGPQLHQGGANRFQVSAARALWLLVPILIGASAATQTLAARLNYHPSLGPNPLPTNKRKCSTPDKADEPYRARRSQTEKLANVLRPPSRLF